ncbi:catalase [Sphingomonas sp. DBB INV C78]|uniref:catalase n=1 Tax=Sphingomonas sp. DBB INV C78 TaxID=3349434 RepID=UPI0036D3E297
MADKSTFTTDRGEGGETHQHVPAKGPHDGEDHLTTNQGIRVSDNQNQLKVGARGPVLLEDFALREKIFHFDHERIPERIVHARGSAAHGYFELYESLSDITKADIFQRAGEKTPLFTRFSTVAGGAGSVDTPRDVRGFAVKFYTKEGNWDLVGNNIPVFFIQDAIKFPDLVHSVKMEADRGYPQAASAHDTFWDFISLMPESTHMIMWAMSDRTIPRSLAMIEGFGVHTFRMINAEGNSTFVKFHWKPKLGVQSTIWDEAVKIAGADPDFHRRDLFERIDRGDFPEWELGLQLFDEAFAEKFEFDVLDPTKIIPEEVLPVRIVGRMVLDRWPDNFFAETEQVAYCPANIVPGLDFTNDPLLQGRLFSYLDTQKSRLGTANFHQIPINAAKCPVMNFQRDGMMQMLQPKGRANYEPNSLNEAGEVTGPRECPATGFSSFDGADSVGEIGANKVRLRSESFADHYSQARLFFRSLHEAEQAHLASALVFELSKVGLVHVRTRMLSNLVNVDAGLAKRVAEGLAMPVPKASLAAAAPRDFDPSPALRIIEGPRQRETLEGRAVGILYADGSDGAEVAAVRKAVEAAKGKPVLISPKVGGAKLNDGTLLAADGQLAGTPSVIVDAIALVLSADGAAALAKDAAAVQFVMDAFGHLKAIGASDGAKALLSKAGVEASDGVTGLGKDFIAAAGRRFFAREPEVRMLA